MLMRSKPQTVQDPPDYRQAVDRLSALREEHASLDREIDAARVSRAQVPARTSRLEDEARTLLSGEGGGTAVAVASLEAIDKMSRRRNVIAEAIRLQKLHVEKAKGVRDREIATAARPEYEAIIRKLAEALVALSDVAEEEGSFRDRFLEQGISFASVIPPCPLEAMRLSVYGTRANRWADDVERDFGIRLKNRRRQP